MNNNNIKQAWERVFPSDEFGACFYWVRDIVIDLACEEKLDFKDAHNLLDSLRITPLLSTS